MHGDHRVDESPPYEPCHELGVVRWTDRALSYFFAPFLFYPWFLHIMLCCVGDLLCYLGCVEC